jgi:hypothetical protein
VNNLNLSGGNLNLMVEIIQRQSSFSSIELFGNNFNATFFSPFEGDYDKIIIRNGITTEKWRFIVSIKIDTSFSIKLSNNYKDVKLSTSLDGFLEKDGNNIILFGGFFKHFESNSTFYLF